jgi:hypothetical protein
MSDPIKLIFSVTAHSGEGKSGVFLAAANERTVELCQRFYRQRLNPGAVLPAPAVLRFVHFECERNKINVFEFSLSTTAKPRPPKSQTQPKWTALADFMASGDPSFSPISFVDSSVDSFGRFTILNIYHSIRGAPPKSVLELSIFGHGWTEGPVIQPDGTDCPLPSPPTINGLPIRTTDDTDGRARTDFEDNMGEDPNLGKPPVTSPPTPGQFPRTGGKDALKEFKAAFDPQASFIIFGCNGQDPVRDPVNNCLSARLRSSAEQVIHQAYVLPIAANEARKKNDAAKIGKVLATGNVPADLEVPIDMGAEFDEERHDIDLGSRSYEKFHDDRAADKAARTQAHYGLDPPPTGFFPAATELKFNRKWSRVLGFVARRTQQTYAFKAASKLGIDVIGGPAGTLSMVGEKDRQQLVCGEFRGSRCTRIVRFHELFMRTTPSRKSERNYFVYDAATVAHINTLAQIH